MAWEIPSVRRRTFQSTSASWLMLRNDHFYSFVKHFWTSWNSQRAKCLNIGIFWQPSWDVLKSWTVMLKTNTEYPLCYLEVPIGIRNFGIPKSSEYRFGIRTDDSEFSRIISDRKNYLLAFFNKMPINFMLVVIEKPSHVKTIYEAVKHPQKNEPRDTYCFVTYW